MRALFRRITRRDDAGVTLVEMMVAISLLMVVSTIFTATFTDLQRGVRKQNGFVDAAAGARRAFALLDRQVRYANTITVPGTDGAGNLYVEWQSGNPGTTQTCTQWRAVVTSGQLQQRSWTVPGNGGAVAAPAWQTVLGGVVLTGQPAVFSTELQLASAPDAVRVPASANLQFRQLGVVLTVQAGLPVGSASTSTTFTAANSSTASAPAATTCNQVARS